MAERRRTATDAEARRRLSQRMRVAGEKVRLARRRRRLTQAELGRRVGVHQSAISRLELGDGAAYSVLVWERVTMALELPLDFALGRDARQEPSDAGHLIVQELVLRLARTWSPGRRFELPNRSADPTRWTDVGIRDDGRRRLLQIECVNVMDNFGAAIRSGDRKRAAAEEVAVAIGHGRPFSVHQCWVVRATRPNRELVARYPEIFATRFPGSSRAWLGALTT